MRCIACNEELTDDEATNKDVNGFIDTCFTCIGKTHKAIEAEDDNDHIRVGCRDKLSTR